MHSTAQTRHDSCVTYVSFFAFGMLVLSTYSTTPQLVKTRSAGGSSQSLMEGAQVLSRLRQTNLPPQGYASAKNVVAVYLDTDVLSQRDKMNSALDFPISLSLSSLANHALPQDHTHQLPMAALVDHLPPPSSPSQDDARTG